eukprot:1189681-Prorocentrum_minimum.AAC.2
MERLNNEKTREKYIIITNKRKHKTFLLDLNSLEGAAYEGSLVPGPLRSSLVLAYNRASV